MHIYHLPPPKNANDEFSIGISIFSQTQKLNMAEGLQNLWPMMQMQKLCQKRSAHFIVYHIDSTQDIGLVDDIFKFAKRNKLSKA